MGLDTPVVLAVNDEDWVLLFVLNFMLCNWRIEVNALSFPPGKYVRKSETQRN